MYSIYGISANEAWLQATQLVQEAGEVVTSRNFRDPNNPTKTKELLHASITIADPRQRIVFARPINPAFAMAEVLWIMAGANTLEFLKFWNPRMKTWAEDGVFHGAYGARLGSKPRISSNTLRLSLRNIHPAVPIFDQLRRAYEILSNDKDSRQVVLNIYNYAYDLPFPNGKSRSPDIPCNVTCDLKIRDGKLHWLQTMRSNDLMWGTPYNIIQWTTIQEIVAGWLGVELGNFTLVTSSLHVYENHWEDLAKFAEIQDTLEVRDDQYSDAPATYPPYATSLVNSADLSIETYEAWERVFERVLSMAVKYTSISSETLVREVDQVLELDHSGYMQILALLAAEALRRNSMSLLAHGVINHAGYYAESWVQWAKHIEDKTSQ